MDLSLHLATVEFPDGRRRYTLFSTVVNALHEDLYASYVPATPTSRPTVVGEPEPADPWAPMSPLEELLVVRISELDHRWHALYCPRRRLLIGPMSPHHHHHLQRSYTLVDGTDGRRHLRHLLLEDPPLTSCGRAESGPGSPVLDDLFAGWPLGDVCRDCLMGQLPDVDEFPEAIPDW